MSFVKLMKRIRSQLLKDITALGIIFCESWRVTKRAQTKIFRKCLQAEKDFVHKNTEGND